MVDRRLGATLVVEFIMLKYEVESNSLQRKIYFLPRKYLAYHSNEHSDIKLTGQL